jgi:hypothetical protein
MKRLGMLLLAVMVIGWALPYNIDQVDPEGPSPRPGKTPAMDRLFVDSIGDIRAVLGSQGKSICVSGGGEVIAILYGHPSGDPNNSMEAYVAYSTDGGATFTLYGPHGTPPARRLYNDVCGTPNFHANPGELWFCWQENTQGYNDGEILVMIEENIPSSPSFSVPGILTNSQPPAMYPWEPAIDWDRDNPQNLVATAWSFLANGNEYAYAWTSNDGGYTWSDSIPMTHVTQDGACGPIAFGTGGYVAYTFHQYRNLGGTDSIHAPWFMESTDGGSTWSTPISLDVMPAGMSSNYWWHEIDCLVINGEPWVMHNDIGTPPAGASGGPYIAKGTGSPGSWTWTMYDMGVLGFDSTWYSTELWQCGSAQYTSLSYDPVDDIVMASCKGHAYIGPGPSPGMWTQPHIIGMCTMDGGSTWNLLDPLSTYSENLVYADWNATETADHLVNDGNYNKAYSVWVDEVALSMYFESEYLTPWGPPLGVDEVGSNLVGVYHFGVTPSVTSTSCRAAFIMPSAGHVSLNVYDVTGRVVDNVFSGQASGEQEFNINTSQLANGAYFVVLETEQGEATQKIITLH